MNETNHIFIFYFQIFGCCCEKSEMKNNVGKVSPEFNWFDDLTWIFAFLKKHQTPTQRVKKNPIKYANLSVWNYLLWITHKHLKQRFNERIRKLQRKRQTTNQVSKKKKLMHFVFSIHFWCSYFKIFIDLVCLPSLQ